MNESIPLLSGTALGEKATLDVERLVLQNLEARMKSHPSFPRGEIALIAALPHRLLPNGYKMTEAEEQTLRALASNYRFSMRPPHAIESHRKYLGPVIVSVKRVMWRVFHFFLSGAFQQLEDFHRLLITSHARQLVEIDSLKKLIADQQSERHSIVPQKGNQ